MKKILLVLLFAISLFSGEINIPKGIGDVDGAVYTADGKTLYTLKNETVTKWSVEPLKQLDTFETTVNHLRDYVSEEIDKNYLEELIKDDKSKSIDLDDKGDVLTVSSRYISETWNLKTKKLFFGGVKGVMRIVTAFKEQKHMLASMNYTSFAKPLRSVKMSSDNVPYYEIYLNTNIRWKRKNQLAFLLMNLSAGIFPKHEITTILTRTDDVSLIYSSILAEQIEKSKKEVHIVTTRVFLAKVKPSNPYAEVWKTKNAHEAMEKLYGTTTSQAFTPNDYNSTTTGGGYTMRAAYGLNFNSLIVSSSLEEGGVPYPLMILHSDVIDTKSLIGFAFLGEQLAGSHGSSEAINLTIFGQTKEKKIYEWNTLIPGSPGDF